MSALLLSCNATVTVCHSKTERIDEICRQADLIVVACGCAHLVKKDWVRPGVGYQATNLSLPMIS